MFVLGSTLEKASLAIAALAGFIAFLALLTTRSLQTRDALARLLEEFDRKGFNVLMWRGEQATRPGKASWALDAQYLDELQKKLVPDRLHVLKSLTGSDWSNDRAAMDEFHFFVLRLHAWVTSDWLAWQPHRYRLLSRTFGYQFLSSLLDHRIIALRLRRRDQPDDYFATQYGVVDRTCKRLVSGLAKRTLAPRPITWRSDLPEPVRDILERKLLVTDARVAQITPQHTRMTSRLGTPSARKGGLTAPSPDAKECSAPRAAGAEPDRAPRAGGLNGWSAVTISTYLLRFADR